MIIFAFNYRNSFIRVTTCLTEFKKNKPTKFINMKLTFLKGWLLLIAVSLCMPLITSCGEKNDDPTQEPTPTPTPTPGDKDVSFDVPDKDGYNIKGVVYCGTKAVKDVVVSDGVVVTKTDEDGRYYINSAKRHGSVFVSFPSGYTVKKDGLWPQFYGKTSTDKNTVDQINFELLPYDKKDYVVIGIADIHIANVRQTLRQFTDNYLPDINKTIRDYKMAGKDVYILTMGDQSHDLYWYDNGGVDIDGTKYYFNKLEADAFFSTMGNHDNDPYYADDYLAETRFRATYGPTHYSFNIAGTHYITLDDIVYTNAGGAQGTLGDREYETRITTEQMNWLKNDLKNVSKSTPIVICMHSPLWRTALLQGGTTPTLRTSLKNNADVIAALSGYRVTFLTGHAHVNTSNRSGSIVEYNIGSGAGRLWESGQDFLGKNHICGDGSGGGYFVMEFNGTGFSAYYKCIGYDKDYQFRTYDLNNCHITAEKYCPKSTDNLIINSLGDSMDDYKNKRSDNIVRINVFGFNERWKIKVTENGKTLATTRKDAYDPLWIISVPCKLLDNRQSVTSGKLPSLTSHIFDVKASSATSTLEIEVTDEWGNTYKETMTRPKQLTCDMK